MYQGRTKRFPFSRARFFSAMFVLSCLLAVLTSNLSETLIWVSYSTSTEQTDSDQEKSLVKSSTDKEKEEGEEKEGEKETDDEFYHHKYLDLDLASIDSEASKHHSEYIDPLYNTPTPPTLVTPPEQFV